MDTARQLIRWALPGWIGFLYWLLFVAISYYMHGQGEQLLFEHDTFATRIRDLLLPLVGAAIPFGFIIYQAYYWIFWSAPIPRFPFKSIIFAGDRGRLILAECEENIDWEAIFGRSIFKGPVTSFREGKLLRDQDLMNEYRQNWILMESIWYLALADERYRPVINFLENRLQFLSDIYHSLGASNVAIVIAFVCYGAFHEMFWIFDHGLNLESFVPFCLNAAILTLTFVVFKKGRGDSFFALSMLRRDVIMNVMLDKPVRKTQT